MLNVMAGLIDLRLSALLVGTSRPEPPYDRSMGPTPRPMVRPREDALVDNVDIEFAAEGKALDEGLPLWGEFEEPRSTGSIALGRAVMTLSEGDAGSGKFSADRLLIADDARGIDIDIDSSTAGSL
jgi:hypothetical protein